MIQKKEAMQTASSAGEYLAPNVEVVEFRRCGVICASDPYSTYGSFTSPEEEG